MKYMTSNFRLFCCKEMKDYSYTAFKYYTIFTYKKF